ncbi:hypothetical protein ACK4RQ_20200, partial [Proteus mirabilis]
FFMGDLLPSKKNEMVYLETENQLEEIMEKNTISYFNEIREQNDRCHYFYAHEKYIYQEHYYYKVIPVLIGKTLDM